MRYESIELIGYIGFFNGMGLTQVVIDLTQCQSNKIIIRGSNGSGKSTLMSAIHLLPDSNDKFIPDMEARKTLRIRDGDTVYVIRYVHPVTNNGQRGTTKGYITKAVDSNPPVELNPSGIITNCKDIIYDEFAFDAGFASLAQLSSEDRGLVDKRPTERKKMINAIVSSLDVFNDIYRNISKKAVTMKSLMGSLTSKIDMIGNEQKLMAGVQILSKKISDLEDERETTIEAIAAIKIRIADFKQTLTNSNYSEVMEELNGLTLAINKFESDLTKLAIDHHLEAGSIKTIQDYHAFLQKECLRLEAEIDSLTIKIPELMKDREGSVSILQEKQIQLETLQSDSNFKDVMAILTAARAKATECEAIFNQIGLSNVTLVTKDEFNAAMASLTRLKEMAEVLLHNNDIADISFYVNQPDQAEAMISAHQRMKNDLEVLREQEGRLSKQAILYAAKRDIAKELANRPPQCVVDSCVYIAEALKADRDYPEDEFQRIQASLSEVEDQIKSLAEQITRVESLSEVRTDILSIQRELAANIKFILKLPVRSDFQDTFLDRVLAFDHFMDIDALYPYIDCGNMLEEYKILTETIRTYEAEERMYQSKAVMTKSMNDDITVLQTKINQITAQIAELQRRLQMARDTLETRNSVMSQFLAILKRYTEEHMVNVSRRDELTELKSKFDSSAQQVEFMESNLSQLYSNLTTVNAEVKSLTDQREGLNHSLMMLAEYKTELAEYQKQSVMIEKVRYYSSPSSGIQTVYIGIFMNRILSTANQLLGLLFGGEFILQPFIVNDSEFRIPIMGDGLLHDDISSMSSAQKALISMIISFSLLQQSSTRYNVLVLDEYDGCMDQTNRFAFVQLLDSLMGMLQCEQCFIVSHNSELDTSNCDIIALKNTSNELINGNVIWQY